MSNPLVGIDLQGIGGLVSGIGTAAKDIRAAITGKPVVDAAAQAEYDMKLAEITEKAQEAANALILAQTDINKVEAANPKLFVSGWRPFIGWVSGISLGVYFIPRFILGMVFWTISCIHLGALQPMPDMGVTDLVGLLGAMLGFGAFRTTEKIKGVASS